MSMCIYIYIYMYVCMYVCALQFSVLLGPVDGLQLRHVLVVDGRLIVIISWRKTKVVLVKVVS